MSENNDMVRSEGKTVAEAVSEALLRLGAREEEVEITVIEEGKSGLFGVLGRKAACVEVQRKPRKRSRRRGGRGRRRGSESEGGGEQRQAQGDNRQSRDSGGRDQQDRDGRRRDGRDDRSQQGRGRQDDGRQDRERRPRKEEPRQEPRTRDERPAAARQDGESRPTREPRQRRERPRREERPRDEQPRTEQPRVEQPRAAAAPSQDGDNESRKPRERRERRPRGRDRDQNRDRPRTDEENVTMQEDQQPTQPTQPRREERPAATILTGDPLAALDMAEVLPAIEGADIDETIARTAEDLLRRCGIFSRAQVSVGDDGYHNVRMVTDANSADIMAGRRNSIINSVQHLCDRIASKASGDHVKVNVDINNHRQRRDGGLAQMAESAVNRLKETGEEQHLDPMNARERRIVHMEIAEIEGVDTTTIGEGPDRHVVIIVAKDEAASAAAPEKSSDE